MLKRQPAANLGYTVNGICGQIFCHTLTDFTIDCALCDEKSLPFESFRSHIQNKHFEDILQHSQAMNTECNQYLDVSVKNEAISDVEDNFYDTNAVNTDEENTNTLKKFATKGDVQEVKDKLESTNLILKLLFDKINLLQTIEAQPNTNTLRTTTDFQNNLITNTDLPPSLIRISVLPKIPFENKDDFLNLEIGVQSSEEMFANMIRELKQKVLGNSTKFIRNCWRLIMRDEVAKEFCWQGSPSKTSLKPLTTTLGIKMAYTEKFSDHTDVEFEKITIMHFQQAKNRCDKKSKNMLGNPEGRFTVNDFAK